MGKKWIQLLQLKHIERHGKQVPYRKGDFVQVGNQTALRWILEGSARALTANIADFAPAGDGIGVLLTNHPEVGRHTLKDASFPIEDGDPSIPWGCTFLWDPDAPLRAELLSIGFGLLNTWEFACPLLPYERLASKIGSPDDQHKTKELIGDLRVPLYDPRIIFTRKTDLTDQLVQHWWTSVQSGTNTHHALLRAIYQAKPLVLALPPTWANPNYRAEADDW